MNPKPLFRFAALVTALIALAAPPAFGQTLEQMAGQMIIVGFAGDSANDKSVVALREEIAAGVLGGVMYLKPNVSSLKAVAAMNAAFRAAAPELPPFITLDQEGGAVERLTSDVGFAELPSAAEVAAKYSPEQAVAVYQKMAAAISQLGFSVNFGPVADLGGNRANTVINKFGRAFSADPARVAAYAGAFVRAHRAEGVASAIKHFPGHGSSTADSHEGFVDITRTWRVEELIPFRTLIAGGMADMVMLGHLYHGGYDTDARNLPASLSHAWITGVLRGDLGFEGVVVTDDMEMGAIRDHFSTADAAVTAVRAGADILLYTNTAKYHIGLAREVRDVLVQAAERDPALRARIEESYRRIVALKAKLPR